MYESGLAKIANPVNYWPKEELDSSSHCKRRIMVKDY
jgi:hypothetical protein